MLDINSTLIIVSNAIANPLLDFIAVAIHNDFYFIILLMIAVLLRERNPQKLWKVFVACVFVLLLSAGIKSMLKIDRPCTSERFAYLCPDSYSFPSLHAAIAFAVAMSFLQKRSYPPYALLALFVAFTRIYLGVHSFEDIAGGMAIGIIGYYIIDVLFERPQHHIIITALESMRKLVHIALGFALLAFLLLFGRMMFLSVLFVSVFIGSIISNFYSFGKVRAINFFRDNFERVGVRMMGLGSALYLLGVLISAAVLQNEAKIAAAIIIFALGDGAASLLGLHAKHLLPWNRKKTWEGFIAFIICSLPAYFFIGPAAIPLIILCAFVESLSLPIDDNVLLPAVATAVLLVI
ncbi:MAG: phosphatase PAP2 family protein [Candidatus Aenigmarchaeota archaeon]|nr:phosphatase PAP2 family protein [Candidatus Aenigmarchaeota archaeon]